MEPKMKEKESCCDMGMDAGCETRVTGPEGAQRGLIISRNVGDGIPYLPSAQVTLIPEAMPADPDFTR